MNRELDWPVERAAVAVVSASEVETAFRGGVSGADQFEVASVTKLMTTLAALAAVEVGPDRPRRPSPRGQRGRHRPATCWPTPAASSRAPRQGPRPRAAPHLLQRRVPGAGRGGRRRRRALLRELAGHQRAGPAGHVRHPARPPPALTLTLAGRLDPRRPDPPGLLPAGARRPGHRPRAVRRGHRRPVPGLAGVIPGIGRFDPATGASASSSTTASIPTGWGGAAQAAFGHFGATGCFLWVDPAVGLATAAVTDRDFVDDKWAMATWPAWSDSLPAAGP